MGDEVDDLPEHEVVVPDSHVMEEIKSEMSGDLEEKIALDESEKESDAYKKDGFQEKSEGSVEAVRDNEIVEVAVEQKCMQANATTPVDEPKFKEEKQYVTTDKDILDEKDIGAENEKDASTEKIKENEDQGENKHKENNETKSNVGIKEECIETDSDANIENKKGAENDEKSEKEEIVKVDVQDKIQSVVKEVAIGDELEKEQTETKDKASHSKEEEISADFLPGVLEITVQKASELVNEDMIGKSDPYVKIKFGDQEFKSRKVRNTLEPEWNFSANLIVTSSDENSDIVIEVFDDDFGKENFIGSYKFSIKHAIKETHKGAVWYNLVGCKSGKIFFSTIYSPDDEPDKKSTKDEEDDKSYIQKDSKDVKEEPGKHDSFITDIQDSDGKQEEKNSSQEKDESEEKLKGLEQASEQNDTASSKDEKVCSSEELIEKVSLKNEKIIATEKEEEKPTIDKNKTMETAVNVQVDKVKEEKSITHEEVPLKKEVTDDKISSFETKTLDGEKMDKPADDNESTETLKMEKATENKEILEKLSDEKKENGDIKEQHPTIEECMVQETAAIETESLQKEESTFMPGVLEITVQRASELVNNDKIGKSDPYVKVRYVDEEFRSKTINNTLEPEWNFSCEFDILNLEEKYIHINVYDDDFGKDNIEGCYSLFVKEAIFELVPEGKWFDLVGCQTGKVYISTRYTPIKMKDTSTEKPVQKDICKDTSADINAASEKEEVEPKIESGSLEKEERSEQLDASSSKDQKVVKDSLKEDKEEEEPNVAEDKKRDDESTIGTKQLKDEKEPGAETMAAVPVKDDKIPIESTIESDYKVKDAVPIPEEKVFAAKETVGEASLNDEIKSQDEKELKHSPIKKVSKEDDRVSTDEKQEDKSVDDKINLKEEKITAKGVAELKDAISSKQEKVSAPTETVDKESVKDENISADQKEEEKSAEDEAPLQDEKVTARGAMELKDILSSEHKKLSAPVETVDNASLKDDTTSVNEKDEKKSDEEVHI